MAKEEPKKIEELKRQLAEMRQRLMDYEKDFELKIQENPVTSVGVAFGAGMLVGVLTGWIMSKR